MNGQMALFVDFENIAIWAEQHQANLDVSELMKYLRGRGAVVVKRAYADWANFTQYRNVLLSNAIDLIQLYAVRDGKNRADVRMALDAFETTIQHPQIPIVVIVSGDSDFGPLVNKLRAYGKYVVGISPRAIAHRLLISACDEFVYLEAATGTAEKQQLTQSFADREEARQLLMKAMSAHEGRGEMPVLATRLKQTMLSMDSSFNEANLGYSQFRAWLEASRDLVTLFFRELQLFVAPVGFEVNTGETEPAPGVEDPSPRSAEPREALLRRYWAVFNRVVFVDLQTRRDILLDIYCELSAGPGKSTSEEILGRLQARYESEGKARHQAALLRVWQTGFYQRAYDFGEKPASFKVPVRLSDGIESAAAFIRRVESGFVYAILKDDLEIDYAGLAEVLLGDPAQTAYIRSLFADVRQRVKSARSADGAASAERSTPTADRGNGSAAGSSLRLPGAQGLAAAAADVFVRPEARKPVAAVPASVVAAFAAANPAGRGDASASSQEPEAGAEGHEGALLFPRFLASEYLHPVMDDIANAAMPGDAPINAETAARLAREATDARYQRNFGAALLGYLQACRVQAEVLQQEGDGATVEDLAWYMASYASVRAGALSQSRRDYAGARPYYLAFFYLLRVEPTLWARVEGLIAPMLHHYWANVGREMGLEFQGPAQPARLALEILDSSNPALRAAWNQANQELAKVNPDLLRWVVTKIKDERQKPQ